MIQMISKICRTCSCYKRARNL